MVLPVGRLVSPTPFCPLAGAPDERLLILDGTGMAGIWSTTNTQGTQTLGILARGRHTGIRDHAITTGANSVLGLCCEMSSRPHRWTQPNWWPPAAGFALVWRSANFPSLRRSAYARLWSVGSRVRFAPPSPFRLCGHVRETESNAPVFGS